MRTKAGRYRAGWTRLSAGGKKRRAAALAAEAEVGSWEWATTTAGDRTTVQRMPPHRASERGVRSRPPSMWTTTTTTQQSNSARERDLAGNVGKCVCRLHPSNDRHFYLSPTCQKCRPDTSATFSCVALFLAVGVVSARPVADTLSCMYIGINRVLVRC